MTDRAAPTDAVRGPFVERADFIENAFERRFQGILRAAWRDRTWHVVAAVPGSGKSCGIADLVVQGGACKGTDGHTSLPVLAIRSPKNARSETALGNALTAAFGVAPRLPWDQRRTWLVAQFARAEVALLVDDDAQDLSLAQLAYLKELTDNLVAPPYERRLGLCLVTASEGGTIPLRETLQARRELLWRQFRRRLSGERPYLLILGHTEEEVREVLAGYEDLYRDQFPGLALCRWAGPIYRWLTHPALDPEGSGRVAMDNLGKLVVAALRGAHARGEDDVGGDLLRSWAEAMTLRRDAVLPVDGEPPEETSPVAPAAAVAAVG